MKSKLDRVIWEEIASPIRGGQYSLLLGAGASADSKSRNASGLPSGSELRNELCALKGAREGSTLQRVFSSLSASEVELHVIDRFKGCTAGKSLIELTKFLWHRIYTLNIDDALEDAYRNPTALQILRTFNYGDQYKEWSDNREVSVIHLHGWVGKPNDGFVFSNADYVRTMHETNAWMVTLTEHIRAEQFIIAGTSLDEVDIEYYLASRSAKTTRKDRAPSILVEPRPDGVTKSDCEKHDLVLYEGTLSEFLRELNERVADRPNAYELIPRTTRDLFPTNTDERTVLSFAADFELIPNNVPASSDPTRFLFGHEPDWGDLAGNVDVGRNLSPSIINSIESALKKPLNSGRLLLLLDEVGSGKSTVLRRIGYDLACRGMQVLKCSALSRLPVSQTVDGLNLIKGPVVVLIDDFAEQTSAIADIISQITKEDLVFLCAERKYRKRHLKNILSGIPCSYIDGLDLTDSESRQLMSRYSKYGLQAISFKKSKELSIINSLTKDPIAVASCRILNDFRPLQPIINSIISSASLTDLKRYLIASLATHCIRSGVRYDILASISGRDGWDDQSRGLHPLPLTFYDEPTREFVVPLNPFVSTQVLESISINQRPLLLEVFIGLAKALSPRVNRGTIKNRTPEARLSGRLFDYDQVVQGLLHGSSILFYEGCRDAWEWNSRYWEQVALLHLEKYFASKPNAEANLNIDRAVQHARHAVQLEVHPLSLTTLGKILIAKMASSDTNRSDIFDEAFECLLEAINLEKNWTNITVHPFISLFRGVKQFSDHGGNLSGNQLSQLRREVSIASHDFSRDQEVLAAIDEIQTLL